MTVGMTTETTEEPVDMKETHSGGVTVLVTVTVSRAKISAMPMAEAMAAKPAMSTAERSILSVEDVDRTGD